VFSDQLSDSCYIKNQKAPIEKLELFEKNYFCVWLILIGIAKIL